LLFRLNRSLLKFDNPIFYPIKLGSILAALLGSHISFESGKKGGETKGTLEKKKHQPQGWLYIEVRVGSQDHPA